MLNANQDIDDDVKHKIIVGWVKQRAAGLYDKQIPTKLEHKFYRTTTHPTLLYAIECWTTKKVHIEKMRIAQMWC